MVLAHGFGCDQSMWNRVAPAFAATHRLVLFDHVGAGGSIVGDRGPDRYGTLSAYAEDLLELIEELDLRDVVFVGHSVSAIIGVLAANRAPDRFAALVLVGPSPRYVDDEATGYVGGFTREDIDGLLENMSTDYLGWSSVMAPVIMGRPDVPALGEELTESFCRTDPAFARSFARATFLSDNRADLEQVRVPTLILQARDDAIAPLPVGRYVHAKIRDSAFVVLDAVGHCPHLSAPAETVAAIRAFV
jgi:sigma-B regulation protein RsbQ